MHDVIHRRQKYHEYFFDKVRKRKKGTEVFSTQSILSGRTKKEKYSEERR